MDRRKLGLHGRIICWSSGLGGWDLDLDYLGLLEMKGLTWTTLTTQQREKGSVRKMNTMETTMRRWAQIP